MTKRVTAIAAVLIVMLLSGLLMAQQHETGEAKGTCKGKGTGLTDEQHVTIEKLGLELRLKNIDLKAEQKKLHHEAMEELLKDEPSRKALDAMEKKIAAVQSKLHKNKLDHLMAVRKVLNAEQWKHFVKKHHAMKGSHCGCSCGCCGMHGAKECGSGHGGCRCTGTGCSGHGGCRGTGMGCGMHGHMKGGCCSGAMMHQEEKTCSMDESKTIIKRCMKK
jgi:hypothetical protein